MVDLHLINLALATLGLSAAAAVLIAAAVITVAAVRRHRAADRAHHAAAPGRVPVEETGSPGQARREPALR
jgi:hypothetical protein